MTDRYKEFATKALATEQARAIDKALGLPLKGANIGEGPHVAISDVYTPGAAGWTETECDVVSDADGKALLTLTERAAALGRVDVDVDGKPVAIDTSGTVDTKPVIVSKPVTK